MSSPARPVNATQVLADLRQLRQLTEDEHGAQRLCWTDTWAHARTWFDSLLEGLDVTVKVDAAGNKWVTLSGERPEAIVLGSHIDSVPNGGWLDGALGLLAGLEVLRAVAAVGRPPFTLKLVDWADEEGARFGYGMLGSSAVSGSLDVEKARMLVDREGNGLPAVLAGCGVELDRMPEARGGLAGALAYIELHIEQGPVLEEMGLPLAVVTGTLGVERHVVRFRGQAAHAGPTPMEKRREALSAAARLLLELRDAARNANARFTAGRLVTLPGVATIVAETAELTIDQRHPDGGVLARLLEQARSAAHRIGLEEQVDVEIERLWNITPITFDPDLRDMTAAVIEELTGIGAAHRMESGALHDAAEVARAGVPTVMIFVKSLGGISHTKVENSSDDDVILSVEALARLTERVFAWARQRAVGAECPQPENQSAV
jgi:N-carbamoyl-L-amino-acid hydrolase